MYTKICDNCRGIMGVATLPAAYIMEKQAKKEIIKVNCPSCGATYEYVDTGEVKLQPNEEKRKEGKRRKDE